MLFPRWTLHPRGLTRGAMLVATASLTVLVIGINGCGLGSSGNQLPPNTPVVPQGLSGRLLMPREGALVALDLGSGQLSQLVPQPTLGGVTSARWSPDGSQIAYARFEVREQRYPVSEV